MIIGILLCVVALLALAMAATALVRGKLATPVVYSGCLLLSLVLATLAAVSVVAAPTTTILPIGLPWVGARFRLDALAAAFLAIINIGAAGAIGTFCYAVFIVLYTLVHGTGVPGYASLLVAILFFGSLQLMSIGLLGEYIGRIYLETKQRPTYLIRKTY